MGKACLLAYPFQEPMDMKTHDYHTERVKSGLVSHVHVERQGEAAEIEDAGTQESEAK